MSVLLFTSEEFNITTMLGFGPGWILIEEDARIATLESFDPTTFQLKSWESVYDTYVGGDDRFMKAKEAGYLRPGGKAFLTLWKNQQYIPESWKEKIGGKTPHIVFDGIVLKSPGGSYCFLELCWPGDGKWHYRQAWLDSGFGSHHRSPYMPEVKETSRVVKVSEKIPAS
jgi:hypothetical protein